MRAGFVVTCVLGLGTAIVFAVAAVTASLFPNGTVVGSGFNGGMLDRGFGGVAVPMPAPAVNVGPQIRAVGPDGVFVLPDATFAPLPGDLVVPDGGTGSEVAPVP